jgi:ABC-2 type transport system permease protein
MLASLSGEFFKTRKRPATWILASVWSLVVVFVGYVLFYAIASASPPQNIPQEQRAQQEAFADSVMTRLLPENILDNLFAASGVFSTGGAVLLILGALAVGSEFGWGTLKTSLTQRPGRLGIVGGKAITLALFAMLFALIGLGAGALSSLVVAGIEGVPVEWPTFGELARGFGAGTLIFAAYGFFGFALAAIFRGTALAIGLGLAWILVVETTIGAIPTENPIVEGIRSVLLGESFLALSGAFASGPSDFAAAPEPLVEPGRAVITLLAYIVVFVIISALLLKRRDVD